MLDSVGLRYLFSSTMTDSQQNFDTFYIVLMLLNGQFNQTDILTKK
ncbi:hypothetical protein RyT2_02720 [Pseudolactococcus yaeyamensis]